MGWIVPFLVLAGIIGLGFLLAHLEGPAPRDHTCPDCGHYFMIEGRPHDKTACEVAKMRKEMAALRAELEAKVERPDPTIVVDNYGRRIL